MQEWEDPVFDARHVPMMNKEGAPLRGRPLNCTLKLNINRKLSVYMIYVHSTEFTVQCICHIAYTNNTYQQQPKGKSRIRFVRKIESGSGQS